MATLPPVLIWWSRCGAKARQADRFVRDDEHRHRRGRHQHGRHPCRRHARHRGRIGNGVRERRRHALAVAGHGSMLEAGAGGMYEVMLGTADEPSANTILTISADSDRALEDGMTSSATLTIESANGATDRRPRLADGDRQRLHRGGGAAAARSVAPGPVPDGRRRAAVSSAQRIAPSS